MCCTTKATLPPKLVDALREVRTRERSLRFALDYDSVLANAQFDRLQPRKTSRKVFIKLSFLIRR